MPSAPLGHARIERRRDGKCAFVIRRTRLPRLQNFLYHHSFNGNVAAVPVTVYKQFCEHGATLLRGRVWRNENVDPPGLSSINKIISGLDLPQHRAAARACCHKAVSLNKLHHLVFTL